MRQTPPLLVLPRDGAAQIAGWATWGFLHLRPDPGGGVAVVSGASDKDRLSLPLESEWSKRHYLRHAQPVVNAGVWYRVRPELFTWHHAALQRGAAVHIDVVKDNVPQGWRRPGTSPMPMLGVTLGDDGQPLWCCWWVTDAAAVAGTVEVVDEDHDPIGQLRADGWPVDVLEDVRVVVVGVGSIGGVAADALAAYGVPRLDLIDFDRLRQRNVPRHLTTDRDLGRYKVEAVAEHLSARWPRLDVRALPLDVVTNADVIRPLLDDASLVLAAPDGIAARRAASHLAWRAGLPIVLACVLDGGTIGEVLRLRPPAGCLLCHRAALIDAGAIDPEATLDRPYGDGSRHLPMTTPGADLRMVGALAAKAAISTVLEQRGGLRAHQLPGDHAVIGLQPPDDLPAPFDVRHAGEVRWHPAARSRPGCPTCATPP